MPGICPGSSNRDSAPDLIQAVPASPLVTKYNRLQQSSESLASAVQTCLDGSSVNAQLLRRLFGVEFLNVAEEENLSVGIGQPVDGRPDVGAGLSLDEPRQSLILP